MRDMPYLCISWNAAAIAGMIPSLWPNSTKRSAIDSLWNDVTGRKMYLTGGLGSYREKERFGEAYFLPDEETHCETCAGVGSCMWNYRMFCLTGESRYFDIFERTLYNNVLHGISDDGMKFFYANVLQCSPYTFDWEREWARIKPKSRLRRSHRLPWFETSCCPTNLARILLSLPGYAYAKGKNSIDVNLFSAGESAFETAAGEPVELRCETDYPFDGPVRLTLEKAPRKATALRIRIPGWSQGHPVPSTLYTYLNDEAALPEILINDESVEGRIAVERGPIIYSAALPADGKDIRTCEISPKDSFEVEMQPAGFVTLTDTDRQLSFIPYYRHAQDGIIQMSVWLKETATR